MKKLLASLFVLSLLVIGVQAHASILSNALSQIKNLKNEISLLKSSLKASVLDIPVGVTPTTDLTPRISIWEGKLNQHIDIESSTWQTDPDGVSGADIGKLEYCQKWYPDTTSVVDYKNEIINSWRASGSTENYTSIKMSYKCVQGTIIVKTCPVGCTCDNNGDTISCHVAGSDVYATWTEKEIKNFDINTVNTGIVASSDGKKIITVGEYSRYIYKSNNGGQTWTTQTDVGQYDGSGRVFTYPNGSKVGWEIRGWYSITSSLDGKKIALLGHAGDDMISRGTTTSYLYTSVDGGDTWTEHSTPSGTHLYKITSSSDGKKLAAVDYNGYVYTSADSGITWVKQIGSGQYNWSSLVSSSDGSILFATNRGTGYFDGSIYRSTNNGVTWVKLNTPNLVSWNGISTSSDGKKLVAVGSCKDYNNCHIYTSVDGGDTWTAEKNDFKGSSQYYTFVTSSPDGKKLAATGWTNIYLSIDSGVTWTAQGLDGLGFNSVSLLGDGSRMIAGNFNGRIFVGELDPASTITQNNTMQSSGGSSNNDIVASTESSINRTLKVGMIGDDVVILQTFLEITADGSFGPKTKAKVMEWQKANGLTADGAFGAKSRAFAGL